MERNKYFPDFYAHEEELGWLSGGFPLSMETVRGMVATRCELPEGYLSSLEKMALLPVERVFPAHHSLDIQPEIIGRMRDAFQGLKGSGKLRHGSGTFDYGDWAVWL